jgi:hypothetical protein
MLGYRRSSFSQAHQLLHELDAELTDLNSLSDIQGLLFREIVRTEERIRTLKSERKLLAIAASPDAISAKRLSFLDSRIEGYRFLNYVWRCFGDGIAFLYMDKFALKQTFYNTENTDPKQDAGFISGKKGLVKELVFDSLLTHLKSQPDFRRTPGAPERSLKLF